MKEYDFSKIKMEDLRCAVMHKVSACYGIDCYDCPLNNVECSEGYRFTDEANEIFKQELRRREKIENKMPELKAGMIVELEFKPTKGRDLYILLKGDGELQPILPKGGERGSKLSSYIVTKIYENQSVHYSNLFQDRSTHDLTLIWSKNQIKISR